MRQSKHQLIERTLAVWQPRTTQPLTREDARQVGENVTGFFRILLEWQAAEDAREGDAAHPGAKAGAE